MMLSVWIDIGLHVSKNMTEKKKVLVENAFEPVDLQPHIDLCIVCVSCISVHVGVVSGNYS